MHVEMMYILVEKVYKCVEMVNRHPEMVYRCIEIVYRWCVHLYLVEREGTIIFSALTSSGDVYWDTVVKRPFQ